jgi:transposase-like protein
MFKLPEISDSERFTISGRSCKPEFKKLMVTMYEQGVPGHMITATYKVTQSSLYRWRKRFGSKGDVRGIKKFLPVHKKRSIVRAIVSGKVTDKEAIHTYKVSHQSIKKWKELYSTENDELYFSNHLHVGKKKSKQEKPNPASDEVSQLRQELADARLKIAALDTLIDVAEDQLKINIRKKPGARQSSK